VTTSMQDAFERAGFDANQFDLSAIARNWIGAGGTREKWIAAFDEAAQQMPGGRENSVSDDQKNDAARQLIAGEDQHHHVHQDQHVPVPARDPIPGEDPMTGARQGQAGNVPAWEPVPDQSSLVQQDQSQGVGKPVAGEEAKVALPKEANPPMPPARDPIPGEDQLVCVHQDHPTTVPAGEPVPDQPPSVQQDRSQRVGEPVASEEALSAVPKEAKSPLPPARDPSDAYLKALAETQRKNVRLMLEMQKTSAGKVWGSVRPREFPGMKRDGRLVEAIEYHYGPISDKQMNKQLREFLPDAIFKRAIESVEIRHVR